MSRILQRVVTDPALPGFAMTIPAGVSILAWDGQLNTQVSIRQVPLDRNPLPPLPANTYARSLYMFYFGKAGGGTPSAPVPLTFPNDLDIPPGTVVELWYFDEAPDGSRPNAWAQYGTGTVTADGSQVVPISIPSIIRDVALSVISC